MDGCWPIAAYKITPNDYAKTGLAFAHRSQFEQKKPLGVTCMSVERIRPQGGGAAKETGVFMTGTVSLERG